MTDPANGNGTRPAAGRPVEDPEIADLVSRAAAGWSMPPQLPGALTWRDRVGRRPTRRPEHLLAAAAVAAAALVAVAVGAALVNGRPSPDGGPSPAASGVASAPGSPAASASASPGEVGSPSAGPATPSPGSPTTRPPATPLPTYLAPGGAAAGLTVGAIAADGWRVVDMATGTSSDAITMAGDSNGRLFALADGTYLCACVVDGPGSRSISLTIRRYDALGRPGDELAVLEYTSARGRSGDGAPPVSTEPSISADGRSLAVGWTTWDGSYWRSGVDVVDVTPGRRSSGHAMASFELPRVSGTLDSSVDLPSRYAGYAGSGRPLYMWAPRPWISPDDSRIVVQQALVADGARVRVDWFMGRGLPLSTIEAPAPFGGTAEPTDAPCASGDAGDAAWTAPGVFSIVCSGATSSSVLRYDSAGRDLGGVDLSPETGGGSWPAFGGGAVADVGSGTLYLWEPFTRRLVAVDTVGGHVARSATIDPGAVGAVGAVGPLGIVGSLAGRLLDTLVPAAAAKVYLAPALALAPDGRTLYLLATAARSFETTGSGSLGIVVVDAADLAVRARWTPTADLRSIAMSADGRYVLAAGIPGADASGTEAPWEASVTAYDATTGEVRAVAGRLGDSWVELIQPLRDE